MITEPERMIARGEWFKLSRKDISAIQKELVV